MKKVVLFFALVIYFASLSFAGPRIKPKESRDTRIANLREYVIKYNGAQKHRDLIKPGEAYYFPTVKLGYERDTYSDPHLLMDVFDKDNFTKMSAVWLYGAALPSLPDNGKVISDLKPTPPPVPPVGSVEVRHFSDGGFWSLVLLFLLLLAYGFYLANKNKKLKDEIKETAEANEAEKRRLEEELEATKNRLPIEAPEVAGEEWLRKNNPVGRGISYKSDLAESTFEKVYGEKPDLIAKALVSTEANAVTMGFSHNRKANTGLDKVTVYLGWNWDVEEDKLVEVGMIAGPCSNGFQANPEKVVPIDDLFTEFELPGVEFPIVFMSGNIPAEANYPDLLAALVVKYHEPSIWDLKRSGVKIEMPSKTSKQEKK